MSSLSVLCAYKAIAHLNLNGRAGSCYLNPYLLVLLLPRPMPTGVEAPPGHTHIVYCNSGQKSNRGAASVLRPPFDHGDFLICQPIQFIDQCVDLAVGGLDLPSVESLVGGNGGSGQLLMQIQYVLH
jgi:hypothetical protein